MTECTKSGACDDDKPPPEPDPIPYPSPGPDDDGDKGDKFCQGPGPYDDDPPLPPSRLAEDCLIQLLV